MAPRNQSPLAEYKDSRSLHFSWLEGGSPQRRGDREGVSEEEHRTYFHRAGREARCAHSGRLLYGVLRKDPGGTEGGV